MADDRFGCGAENERFGKFLAAANRYNGKFRRKAFHVMLLFFDEALWDKQRKCDVLVTSRLEAAVERALNILPKRPAVRAHDHAATHWRVVRQLRLQDQLVVPLRKIL